MKVEKIDINSISKEDRTELERIGGFLMKSQFGYNSNKTPFYDRGFLMGYLYANGGDYPKDREIYDLKSIIRSLEKRENKLRNILDSNKYIMFVRNSITNAECRRNWKLLFDKKD
jgi:hypothetical protein